MSPVTIQKRKDYGKAYFASNREAILAKAREKYKNNHEYREGVLAKQRDRDRASRANKPPRAPAKTGAQKTKEYRDRNKAKVTAYGNAYRAANISKVREWRRAAHKRICLDPVQIVVKRLRTRLHDEIRFRSRKTRKFCSVLNLVGCTRDELAAWIESQFRPGMSWKNRSLWHIDHIRPVSSFNMLDLEEQRKCFHYSNLQPLWAGENCRKHDSYEAETILPPIKYETRQPTFSIR